VNGLEMVPAAPSSVKLSGGSLVPVRRMTGHLGSSDSRWARRKALPSMPGMWRSRRMRSGFHVLMNLESGRAVCRGTNLTALDGEEHFDHLPQARLVLDDQHSTRDTAAALARAGTHCGLDPGRRLGVHPRLQLTTLDDVLSTGRKA